MHIHHSAHPVPSISHTILLLLPHPISSPLTYSLISLTLHVKQSHQTLLLHSLIPLTLFSHPSHLIISNLLSFNPTLTPYSPNNLASLYHPTLILLSYYSYFTLFPISLHSLAQHPLIPLFHSTFRLTPHSPPFSLHSRTLYSHSTLTLSPNSLTRSPFYHTLSLHFHTLPPPTQLSPMQPTFPPLPISLHSLPNSHALLSPFTPLFYSTLPLAPHFHGTLPISSHSLF